MNWFYSIVLHAALLLIVALAIGTGESEGYFPAEERPDLQVRLVPKGPTFGFERMPDWYGRWRRKCHHQYVDVESGRCSQCVWVETLQAIWD